MKGSSDVLTGGLPAARVGDQATCVGPPDFIAVGASMVLINGRMAARITSRTIHGGAILMGDPTVLIGSSAAGGTIGSPNQGLANFNDAANGRSSGSVQQSYNNCGIEATRLVLGQANVSVSEDALLTDAIITGNARGSDLYEVYKSLPNFIQKQRTSPALIDGTAGGSNVMGRNALLNQYGVPSGLTPATLDNVVQSVAEGKGVVTRHEAGTLWNDARFAGSYHAVEVIGVKYDDAGNVTHVIVNDTGKGDGQDPVPIDQYRNSLPHGDMNVTNQPIYDPQKD